MTNFTAFDEGREAACRGQKPSDNPYPFDETSRQFAWADGFRTALNTRTLSAMQESLKVGGPCS